jgi:aspartyl-tRNA(Asn)/glutamyl-tRNA(Gln) amidotransferase subunit A
MYLADIFTVSANLSGLPAVSIPCGFTVASSPRGAGCRLPVGFQLIGRRFDEATLLRMADAYEHDTEWWMQAPPIASR